MDGWNTIVSFEGPAYFQVCWLLVSSIGISYFQGRTVSFRECKFTESKVLGPISWVGRCFHGFPARFWVPRTLRQCHPHNRPVDMGDMLGMGCSNKYNNEQKKGVPNRKTSSETLYHISMICFKFGKVNYKPV